MENPKNFEGILTILEKLSFQAMGYSSPNPPVACVITDLSGKILSTGFTQKYGENHAEKEAYLAFSKKYIDIKNIPHLVFVTLEPCTHLGQTPPCIDLLLEYLPKAVYYGYSDPNPLVRARNGLKECESLGIEVIQSPEIEKIGKTFLSGFFSRIKHKKPQIFIKSALSMEGYYSDLEKSKLALSNKYSQQISQLLRAKLDAVIVGPVTVYVDFPGLDFRGLNADEITELKDKIYSIEKNGDTKREISFFPKLLLEQIFNLELLEFHNKELKSFQPFRIFVISFNKIPNNGFFDKQNALNEALETNKVIFFILDFDSKNEAHESLRIKMSKISFQPPVIVESKANLREDLFLMFNTLSLNTILVEGGNLLYKLFSKDQQKEDFIYFIRTNKEISAGILPEITIENKVKESEIKIDTDTWEIYGE